MFPRSWTSSCCALDRFVARVRLRGEREVDRRLREVQARLGQPDMLDGLRRCDRNQERARIGVADVLGREHDHAPRDVPRVLAALEHRREVVDARIGIRPAHRLDERRDEVVVRVGGLVVERAAACAPRRRRAPPRAARLRPEPSARRARRCCGRSARRRPRVSRSAGAGRRGSRRRAPRLRGAPPSRGLRSRAARARRPARGRAGRS